MGAKMYEHRDFKGKVWSTGNGAFATTISNFNDTISSIMVEPGYRVIAYEHVNFGGKYKIFEGNVTYVGDEFNDMISSFRVERATLANAVKAEVYEHINYGGLCQQLLEGSYPQIDGLMFVGNDTISSIRVVPGYQLAAYEHINYGGRFVVYTSNTPALGDFNDVISSIIVRNANAPVLAAMPGTKR